MDGQGLWSPIISRTQTLPCSPHSNPHRHCPVSGARPSAPSSRSGPSASIRSPEGARRDISHEEPSLFPLDDHQHPRPKLYSQEAHLEEHQERQYPREALRHISGLAQHARDAHTPPHPPHSTSANLIHYCSLRTPNYTTQLPKAGAVRAPRLCGNWGIPHPPRIARLGTPSTPGKQEAYPVPKGTVSLWEPAAETAKQKRPLHRPSI